MEDSPRITRRRLIGAAAPSAAAAVFAPQALAAGLSRAAKTQRFRKASFAEGVMSGDPTPTGTTLWTRLHDVEGAGSVLLEVATDKDFRKVVASKSIGTSASLDHAAKARVTGLKPHEQYYYRFATKTGDSPVGRFRTALPADSNQPVKFAYFSCQDYGHGFYNAHDHLADEDLDFVVCLGDYIYAEAYYNTANGKGVRNDKIGTATSLADYRDKYKLYRSDAALRSVHQRFPIVTLWDDHEVQDDYAGGDPKGGPKAPGFSKKRQAAAYRAYFDSMPYYAAGGHKNRIYRSLRFGKNVELIVMDQRQYRAGQPYGDVQAGTPDAQVNAPRAFLGTAQMNWVKQRLSASDAAWKIMANEVMIMPTKVLGGQDFGFDSWQGYGAEREELLAHIKDKAIKDVVFVTGDIHTFITGDVRTNDGQGDSVALEFVGGSISSPGLGELDLPVGGGQVLKGNDKNPATPPSIIEALRGINPWIDQADFDHHGYGKITASATGLDSEFVRMKTIKKKTKAVVPSTGFRYHVARGQTSIKGTSS